MHFVVYAHCDAPFVATPAAAPLGPAGSSFALPSSLIFLCRAFGPQFGSGLGRNRACLVILASLSAPRAREKSALKLGSLASNLAAVVTVVCDK